MTDKIIELVNKMTLEEKAGLCSGRGFWHLKSIERLGLDGIMVADGPHGLRKQEGDSDHVGLQKSVPATCFPTASATACSWDPKLMEEMGGVLAKECLAEDVSVILGPGANIKRSPLCGRNFEYISEDPFQTGTMAAAIIKGIQSRGVGTSLKHFAMNNQEARRMTIDSVVDERTQREIYLAGFEKAVRESQPWTVMCSYNRVDGTYSSDSKRLLTDILKEEWDHKGIVVTDWGACNDRVEGIRAGLELEMPASFGKNDRKIIEAVKDGRLSMEQLDKTVERVVELIQKGMENRKPGFEYSREEHHDIARRIAGQSMVLLKNDGILPLSKDRKIAIIGEFAVKPRFQGAGSSLINPTKIDTVCDVLDEMGIEYEYARGYDIRTDKSDDDMIRDSKRIAAAYEKVVVFAGLTDDYESEGYDRLHLRMPESHNRLIDEVLSVNPNTIVVLMNGAPVEMPWVKGVRGLLEAYLGGQAGSRAIVDIIFGDVNPSGKLAETFPQKLADTPSYRYFPGFKRTVEYREGIYVGYRYYDKTGKDVLFPFGFGLSYTTFEYSELVIVPKGGYEYEISVTVTNTGSREGSEVVQLYVGNPESVIYKAKKELKAFGKIHLDPGEKGTVRMKLDQRSFAFYNINIPGWHVEEGIYEIQIGSSCRDIRLKGEVSLEAGNEAPVPDYSDVSPSYYSPDRHAFEIDEEEFMAILGRNLPKREPEPGKFTENSMLEETTVKWIGSLMVRLIKAQVRKMAGESEGYDRESVERMMEAFVMEMPIRAVGMMGGDMVPLHFTEGMVDLLNGKFIKGIGLLLRKK